MSCNNACKHSLVSISDTIRNINKEIDILKIYKTKFFFPP